MVRLIVGVAAIAIVANLIGARSGGAVIICLAIIGGIAVGWYVGVRERRKRLRNDALEQHRALMDGDDMTGLFGRYAPSGLRPAELKAQLVTPTTMSNESWRDPFTYDNVRRR